MGRLTIEGERATGADRENIPERQTCNSEDLRAAPRSTARRPPDDTAYPGPWATDKRPVVGGNPVRLMGHLWNFKRVYRVYTGLGSNIRRRAKKRVACTGKQTSSVVTRCQHRFHARLSGMDARIVCST